MTRGNLDGFIDYVGRRLAQTWESMQGASAKGIVKVMAMNLVPIGGELHAFSGDAHAAGYHAGDRQWVITRNLRGALNEDPYRILHRVKLLAEGLQFGGRDQKQVRCR